MYEELTAHRSRLVTFLPKFLMVMKIMFLLIFIAILQVNAKSYGQKATINVKNASLKEVFYELAKQTGYNFIADPNEVKSISNVTVNMKDASITAILYSFLDKDTFDILFATDQNVLIKRKGITAPIADIVIKGKVTDSKGVPIPGATVKIKNTSTARITDAEGLYTITVPDVNTILVFTYLGYEPQEKKVGTQKTHNISLKEQAVDMADVVILGYTTQNKKDLTGSITSFNAEKQLKDIPNNSAEQALVGRLAGVQITGSEGSLDAEYRIVIRGGGSITQDNSPLYIIDGIQVDDGLRNISPQDIERIDVLKDASATAIYGSRGANGVVVITTKSGKVGTSYVNFSMLSGIGTLPATLPVMSPYEFVLYQWERTRIASAGDQTKFASTYFVQTFADIDSFKNVPVVNWQDRVMGNTALQLTTNVGVSGGTANTKYNISFTNNDQKGIVLTSDYGRNLLNAKLEQKVNDKLKVDFVFRYTATRTSGAGISDGGNAQLNGLRNFIKYKPYLNDGEPVDEFDEDYFNETNQGGGLGLLNPVAWINAKYRKTQTDVMNFGGNINYNISSALSFRSTAGLTFTDSKIQNFTNVLRSIGNPSTAFSNGEDKTINQSNVLTFTNTKFKSKFAKNNPITVLLGQEIYIVENRDLDNRFNLYPRGISAETALNQLTQGTVVPGYPISQYNKSTLLSFFGSANYSHKGKYLASFTLRADGSSKFNPGNQWGYFPSAAIAWRLSNEKFIKDLNLVNDAKLRFTYGSSGNNRIPNYYVFPNFTSDQLYGLNNSVTTFGYQPTGLANPDLTWETTISRNLGLDLAFFNNRLNVTIEAYSNRTNDVITRVPVAFTSGYTSQLQNTANTRNTGLEFQFGGSIINGKKFNWNADFNISFNKNKILSLSSGLDSYLQTSGWSNLSVGSDYIVKVGQPVGSMFGYVSDGFYTVNDFNVVPNTGTTLTTFPFLYQLKPGVPNPANVFSVAQPGLVKVKDLNGDGVISDEDKTVIGQGLPKYFGGLNQQFSYGNFDASFFVNFQVGNDLINANKIEFTNGYLNNNNLSSVMEGRWKTVDGQGNLIQRVSGTTVAGLAPEILAEVNKDASLWQPIRSTPGYFLTSSAIENGSFIRLNNVTLGYTFKASFLNKIKIQKLRLYGTVNNIAVITNYSGFDPEVNTRRATGVTPGVDYSAYPRNRSFIFGLNLSL